MLQFIALLLIGTSALAEKVTFENYTVFSITPLMAEQLHILKTLEDINNEYEFWKGPSYTNESAHVMIPYSHVPKFIEFMNQHGFMYNVYVNNVQELIDNENPKDSLSSGFDFTRYHTLDEIYHYLDNLEDKYPGKVKVVVGGHTYEKRQIKGVKLSFGANKPGIFIEGGIHAREWISPATVLYILNELLTSENVTVRSLAESYDWYIFPSFNPDGYVYTHTTNRLWRKTRQPYGLCYGADPNRNWDFKWNHGGTTENPCSSTFAGSKPFSEIEMKTMSEYITSVQDKIFAYLSFHSYSQLLMFSYGYTTDHLDNYEESMIMGKAAIKALAQRYGTVYRTGNIAETIYVASGNSIDWVKGKFHKPVTYTYELRDTGRHGFVLPANQIIPNGEEVMDSLVALFNKAKEFGYAIIEN